MFDKVLIFREGYVTYFVCPVSPLWIFHANHIG